MSAPKPGQIFAKAYRCEKTLGLGGMGIVFSAIRLADDKRVAIKLLLPEVARNEEIVARFEREANTARAIKSPHCAGVYDVGTASDGTPFMVMEFLEGIDLDKILETRGKVSPEQAVAWIVQACEGVAQAHVTKTVHRDLKPANLFLAKTPEGEIIKVLDFGISKSQSSGGITKTSQMLGSPYYMSPEQFKSSRQADERADIWGLGVILYQLVTGKVPFDANTLTQLTVQVLTQKAPRLPTEGEGAVPAGLADAVEKCLRTERSERFANVGELALAIAPFGPPGTQVAAERVAEIIGVPTQRKPTGPPPPPAPAPAPISEPGATYPPRVSSAPSLPSSGSVPARTAISPSRPSMPPAAPHHPSSHPSVAPRVSAPPHPSAPVMALAPSTAGHTANMASIRPTSSALAESTGGVSSQAGAQSGWPNTWLILASCGVILLTGIGLIFVAVNHSRSTAVASGDGVGSATVAPTSSVAPPTSATSTASAPSASATATAASSGAPSSTTTPSARPSAGGKPRGPGPRGTGNKPPKGGLFGTEN
jgi:serine/threonine-protein kinase